MTARDVAREVVMLEELNRDQAHFVAMLAKAARMQRDAFIARVSEDDLAETKSARGEHNPTAALGWPRDGSRWFVFMRTRSRI
jgi:hypothetical protein